MSSYHPEALEGCHYELLHCQLKSNSKVLALNSERHLSLRKSPGLYELCDKSQGKDQILVFSAPHTHSLLVGGWCYFLS